MRSDAAFLVAKSFFWRLGHPRASLRALLPRLLSLPVRRRLFARSASSTGASPARLDTGAIAGDLSTIWPGGEVATGPLVSIVIPTFNNLSITQICLESLRKLTTYEPLDVIVVDNASTDGTPQWLESNGGRLGIRIIQNESNRGFAAATNQGAREARGEILVFLNNDVVLTPGWLARLVAVLERFPWAGLVGPTTNAIGNEARIPARYSTLAELLAHAEQNAQREQGRLLDVRALAFFCVALRRSTWVEVGELDERFGLGLFEDDDYALRVRRAGMRNLIVRDAFVHHWHEASFSRLASADYIALYERNRALFREKWQR